MSDKPKVCPTRGESSVKVDYAELRTDEQNKKMWAMLHDISKQVKWAVNGYETLMSPDDWKDIFTAGLTKHQRVAQGIEGGWVLLGSRTSKFKKDQMGELIEYIYAFGAQRNVKWSDEKC